MTLITKDFSTGYQNNEIIKSINIFLYIKYLESFLLFFIRKVMAAIPAGSVIIKNEALVPKPKPIKNDINKR